ncbi:TlpA disulfide reductase family protein [Pontibaca methylaminivorans]|uniref:Prolipoprotein diacylglyceryl transferase n=1 Tax=Pontibaca methylaminivorans TaxID=515897 RepID=A0A1R3WY92_9RHOB|nr:TlpA disulfide reductase family protein [Pontibaca methylaminivorans]SIT83255.1 Prolipoprotein diacylglyceryl transferase [Pontibaca methylaminivorans]
MNAVQIGPLVFASDRLVAIIAVLAFFITAELLARWLREESRVIHFWSFALVVGWIIGARLGFVLDNFESFRAHPLDALKIWQGGFAPFIGAVAVALIMLILVLRRSPALMPLSIAIAVTALAAMGAHRVLPDRVEGQLPARLFTDMSGAPAPLLPGGDRAGGVPVVVNLWATWCPPCRREMPMLIETAATAEGVHLVLVNQGESAPVIAKFLRDEGLSDAAILRDPDSTLGQEYEIPGLPGTLFFDSDGALVNVHVGEISRAELMCQIRALQAAP